MAVWTPLWHPCTCQFALTAAAVLLAGPGVSVHFGATSQISSDGKVIAVATAAFVNQLNKYTYMYHMDTAIDRFRIISAINNGEVYADPWPTASAMGINVDNAISMSQSGKYVLRVEDNRLVVYEASGLGMSMTWARRCQIFPPLGYLFRTSEHSVDSCRGHAANAMQYDCRRNRARLWQHM